MSVSSLPESFLGKVILYVRPDGESVLGFRSALNQEGWIDEHEEMEVELILGAIRKLPHARSFDDNFGFHREIPHTGTVRGGAIALVSRGRLLIDSTSQAYGALPRDRTEEILRNARVIRRGDAHFEIMSGETGDVAVRYFLGSEVV